LPCRWTTTSRKTYEQLVGKSDASDVFQRTRAVQDSDHRSESGVTRYLRTTGHIPRALTRTDVHTQSFVYPSERRDAHLRRRGWSHAGTMGNDVSRNWVNEENGKCTAFTASMISFHSSLDDAQLWEEFNSRNFLTEPISRFNTPKTQDITSRTSFSIYSRLSRYEGAFKKLDVTERQRLRNWED
jgi:hypothetical protein